MADQPSWKEEQHSWAAAIAQGDHEAFVEMMADFWPKFNRVLSARLRGDPVLRGEFDDILQDTFLKIWRAKGSYKSTLSSLWTWCWKIFNNTYTDYVRKRRQVIREPWALEAVPDVNAVDPNAPEPEAWHRRPMDREKTDLTAALNLLTVDQRKVLRTKFDYNIKEAEKAQLLGKTPGAFRKTASIALKKVRQELSNRGHEMRRED